MSYDRALTVFSPDGHLYQVEYALEAVRKGTTAVGVKGNDCCVLAVERNITTKLQNPRTVRKIHMLDDNLALCFAGLSADSRVLVKKMQEEVQNVKMNDGTGEVVDVEYMARWTSGKQQKSTYTGGQRPYGVSFLLIGPDPDGKPQLYQCDPAGVAVSYEASVIGKNSKTVQDYLEKNIQVEACAIYESEPDAAKGDYTNNYKKWKEHNDAIRAKKDEEWTIMTALKALHEVVDAGQGDKKGQTVDVIVWRQSTQKHEMIEEEKVDKIVAEIKKIQEEAANAKSSK